MNVNKFAVLFVAALALSAAPAGAQSPTGRPAKPAHLPPSTSSCALSRSCSPGASIDVLPYVMVSRNMGRLRLQIRPTNAEVYVDGVYAGRAEDFDAALTPGKHRIVVSAEGYVEMNFPTRIKKARTTIHRATLSPSLRGAGK